MRKNHFPPSALQSLLLFLGAFAFASPALGENTLVFRSGYEAGTLPNNATALTDIRGLDTVSGFDWVKDLEEHPHVGSWFVEYTGGTNEQRWARVIEEPGNPGNHVLWFNILEPNASNGNGRVQSSLYGNGNIREFTLRNRLYLHPDLDLLVQSSNAFSFFTLFEFWNNPNWTGDPHPFRITLNLAKSAGIGQPLRAHIHAQVDTSGSAGLSQWKTLWEYQSDVALSIAQWTSWEIHLAEGTAETGRMIVRITPQGENTLTLFDITAVTQHPDNPEPNGFTHFNPQKLYTAASRVNFLRDFDRSLQVYWDDFELEIQATGTSGNNGETIINTAVGRGGDTRVIGIGSDRETFNSGGDIFVQVRRRDDWSGANYVGFLKFDLAGAPTTIAESALEVIFADTIPSGPQNLLLFGLQDAFLGGQDESGLPESGEDWLQGNKKFALAASGEITGDNAPGFDETTGRLRENAFTYLGSISLPGRLAQEKVAFSTPELLDFLRADTNNLATIALTLDTNDTSISIVSMEDTIASAPALRLQAGTDLPMWAEFPVLDGGIVDTGKWLGWIFLYGDWIYHWDLNKFLYLPESHVTSGGAWAYFMR